ncbi:MAG TPA: hypothetical protein VN317_08030, partial [Candidatus Methanoperedens sp.]|nr:hypothetical protein [Candidatus Methanoperedens sp.]
ACPRLGGVGWSDGWRDRTSWASAEPLAALAFLGLALDLALTHLVDWPLLFWRLTTALGIGAGPWTETALHAGIMAVPPALALALQPPRRRGRDFGANLPALAGAALPLAAAGLLAVSLRPLLVEGPLRLQRLLLGAGHEWAVGISAIRGLDGLPLRALQEVVVAAGIFVALGAALRRPVPGESAAANGVAARALRAAFVLAAGAALLWICSRQMTG